MKRLILIMLSLFMSSCNDSSSVSKNEDSNSEIQIDNQLTQSIKIVSTSDIHPGKHNAFELQVIIKNISHSSLDVKWDGKWLDSRGNFNGGSQQVLKLAPGQALTINEVTRSPRVTQYKAVISSTSKSQDQLLTESLAENKNTIAKGYGMTYSETPATEKIPNWTVRGVANSLAFDAKTLVFRTDSKNNWQFSISDKSYDPVSEGLAIAKSNYSDIQTVHVNLSEQPFVGKVFLQEMKYGGGIFQIKLNQGNNTTTSWNTSLAYKIEITQWKKGITTRASCGLPKEGKASGKLYISFQGPPEGTIKSSWISGTFNDVSILYCGDE